MQQVSSLTYLGQASIIISMSEVGDKEYHGFPDEIDLFPVVTRISKTGRQVMRFLTAHVMHEPSDAMSTHNRGGGPDLDAALYDHPQLPFTDTL